MTPEILSMLGPMDYLVLGSMASLLVYWFGVRNRKNDNSIPNFRHTAKTEAVDTDVLQDSSFVTKMKNSGRQMISFYGSQTGTGEDFAIRLSKDSARYGMQKGMAADPEEFDMADLARLATEIERPLVVFCVATYGEGDPTDNTQDFFDWLKEDNDDISLKGLNYAVFGLGNKTYEHFNAMAKLVDTRLSEMGAYRVFELGLGDDDANIEDDFVIWRDEFWPAVCKHFGIVDIGDEVVMRQFALTNHEEGSIDKAKIYSGEPSRINSFVTQKMPFDMKNPYLAPVVVNKELHNGGDRSCMHIEFDISDSRLKYDAGDHIGLFARNDSNLVQQIGDLLEVDLDQLFTLRNVDEDASKHFPFPCPTTYRTAFTYYVDITAPLKANMIKELFTTDGKCNLTDLKELDEFTGMFTGKSAEDKDKYNDYVIRNHRTIVHFLEDIKSFRPPIDHICEVLPKLQPRYYSISSSPKLNPTTVHITAVLVDWITPTKRQQRGVATTFLKNIPLRSTVPVYIRKSQFRLPFKNSVDVIMIGPGTGLAPFRGFIQERSKSLNDGKKIGEMVLYFGCRHKEEDFIYRQEMEQFQKDGVITSLRTAFSRDQENKVYVQHLMRDDMDQLWKLINGGAHIYVCGDAKHMAHDVDAVLLEVVTSRGEMSSSAGLDYLKRLRSRGRYSCDIWS